MEIIFEILLYGILALIGIAVLFKLLTAILVFLFEFLSMLPEIFMGLIFLMSLGLPVFLAVSFHWGALFLLPITLGIGFWVISELDNYCYEVRKEVKRQHYLTNNPETHENPSSDSSWQ